MKIIIASLAALILTACAGGGAPDRADDRSSKPMRETTTLSGSATQVPHVRRGKTMSDHDKLVEMCHSINPDADCEEQAMRCHSEADAVACLKNK